MRDGANLIIITFERLPSHQASLRQGSPLKLEIQGDLEPGNAMGTGAAALHGWSADLETIPGLNLQEGNA